MAFKGITFASQNVTPKNDGGLYQAHHGDGILWGCSMNISGDDLVIQSGEFIMGGRYIQVDGATNVDLSGRTLQTGYIQVIMNADLTQGEGNQWYTTFVESATTTFPALTQEDINSTGTLYQVQLAIVEISGGNLTNISGRLRSSTVPLYYFDNLGNKILVGEMTYDAAGGGRSNYYDSNGDLRGGVGVYGNYMHLYGNGDTVRVRPNGRGSTAGQTLFNTDGSVDFSGNINVGGNIDVTGNITGFTSYDNDDISTSLSLSVNSWTELRKFTDLKNGIYIGMGYVVFTPNSNSGGRLRLGISSGPSTSGGQSITSCYFTGTTAVYLAVPFIANSVTSLYLYAHSTVAGSVGLRRIRYAKVG